MSKPTEPHDPAAVAGGKNPIKIQVHVNPMYIVVTQLPPGQTISVHINIKNADGTHMATSIADLPVGTTIVDTSAKSHSAVTELIVVADLTDDPC